MFEELLFKATSFIKRVSPKERNIKRIIDGLNEWSEASEKFRYKEFLGEGGHKNCLFSNDSISFAYFSDYEKSGDPGFWFGARHHFPLKLAKRMTKFFSRYGK